MKHKLVALLIFGFVLLGSCDFFAQNWEMGLHNKTSEQPIGFIKYNNFTYYYSNIKEYSVTGSLAGMYHHYLGINNDGSVKFDSVTAALAGGGIRVFPTMDKGMFVIYSEYFCQSQLNYNIPILIMIDSTGKRIFKTTIGSGIYPTSAEQLSKTCFVYSNQTTLNRFNPTNGIPTSTIYTSSGAISLMIKDKKSNLLFIESNKISLIDTSGTLLATKPSTVQYTKLTSYKSGYIGLKTGNNSIVHRFDSALNIIGTFSTNIYRLRDFSVYKDTVVFVGKKNLLDTIRILLSL